MRQSDVVMASPIVIHQKLVDLTNVKWVHSYWAGTLINYCEVIKINCTAMTLIIPAPLRS